MTGAPARGTNPAPAACGAVDGTDIRTDPEDGPMQTMNDNRPAPTREDLFGPLPQPRQEALRQLLQALLTEEELRALEGRMLAAIPLMRAQAILTLMLPAMSAPERAAFVAQARAVAEDETLVAVIEDSAKASLAPEQWHDLQRRLALAA